ncbi:hypothetical protein [Roseibium sp. RKSG952]|uniref:hypothetical protein n=1 Tax=Roseibium sp. RKSG952 TaxID=2529384 RepID=UPI0012BC0171|nr:hypothetical protein [Roseibium sp. RKSG952]MTH97046.1 hypothetical protein [Roseibium sp. RKSG952]
MQLSVTFENTRDTDNRKSGPIQVGWFLNQVKGGVIFDPPERVKGAERNKTHAKSASRCPAVISMEARYFLIRCPFDINLAFGRDEKGKPSLRNLNGTMSGVRANKLAEMISITSEAEWRYEGVPTIQIKTPYVFISDEPVYMAQTPPFMHYLKQPWPGTLFGGRFPINVWPRPLMWAFEWHDTSKPLVIKRGDPWFYAQFETTPPDRAVVVDEIERTPELIDYMDLISGAVNYVNQTFSLFEKAEARRPETLLQPLKRRGKS